MKSELCKAFCDDLTVRQVEAGYAVGTAFRGLGGDPIGFYISSSALQGFRVEDDGGTVAFLAASGFDIESPTRKEAFQKLLEEYGVEFDDQSGELHSSFLSESETPSAAIRFVACLLRIQDLLLLSPERVENTFRDDAIRKIKDALGGRASIVENEPLDPRLREFPVDMVLKAPERPPVAVFFSQSEQRVYEAILFQMTSLYEARIPCSVIALLEKGTNISHRMRQRASNRLAAIPDYRGDEEAAISRIVREVLGSAPLETVH